MKKEEIRREFNTKIAIAVTVGVVIVYMIIANSVINLRKEIRNLKELMYHHHPETVATPEED